GARPVGPGGVVIARNFPLNDDFLCRTGSDLGIGGSGGCLEARCRPPPYVFRKKQADQDAMKMSET
ncbi:hypothetical protein MX031_24240, partial [Ralstonia solanacearum]|uniref:hypothetical protein n=1 Tax=Ralstonia solanacearum TaxID=305 RepID=UPI00202A7156